MRRISDSPSIHGPLIRVGCAGWSLSAEHKSRFPEAGTHLERSARVFSTVEINSSFYRPHRPDTYRRWADSVPDTFRFTAKVPKEITHVLRLQNAEKRLDVFLSEVMNLGEKLGALLVQLPPRLALDPESARPFLIAFRNAFSGRIAWEARHASWFVPEARKLLREFEVAAVRADPVVAGSPDPLEADGEESGAPFAYFRLHGSPRIYYSAYSPEYLTKLAARLRKQAGEVYCIFDNTALGAAVPNALDLMEILKNRDT